jgi:PAS domain S-box-containing protein
MPKLPTGDARRSGFEDTAQAMQTSDDGTGTGPTAGGLPTPRYLARFWEMPAVLMAVIDDDGFVIVRNPSHQSVLGWTDAEIRSVPFWVLVHPDDRDGMVASCEKGATCEARLLTRSGEYRQVVARVDRDDHTLYLLGVDTTELVAGRPVERAAVCSWQYDLASDTTRWNPEIYDLYGVEPDPAITRQQFCDQVHPEDRTMMEQAIRWSLASGERYDCEFRIIHTDGSLRWLHAAARVYLDDNGDPARMLGITQDVTDSRVRGSRRPGP